MAGIDEILERLVADGDFRAALARDPAAALAGYDLTRADVELLASRLDDGDDAERVVEQRTSKSAMLSFLAAFADPGGGAPAAGHRDEIDVQSWSWGEANQGGRAPDDLAVPADDAGHTEALLDLEGIKGEAQDAVDSGHDQLTAPEADDESYDKSKGKVEYTWKIEEGVKAEIEPDDLTVKGAPEDAKAEIEPDDLTVKVAPDDGVEAAGAVPPDDGLEAGAGASPPSTDDEGIIVINGLEDGPEAEAPSAPPPDDAVEAAAGNPPDDGLQGANPPDDNLVAAQPPPDNGVESSRIGGEELADLADDVLEIGDA